MYSSNCNIAERKTVNYSKGKQRHFVTIDQKKEYNQPENTLEGALCYLDMLKLSR